MTVQDFFNEWNNKPCDFDGAYGNQCVDVFKQYNKDVIGAPNVNGNAKDYWTTFPTDFYTKVVNTPDGVPQLGDVMIWGTTVGQYGHIAICSGTATASAFTSFDQNWPVQVDSKGNGLGVCHFQPHNYVGILGWLHPKSLPTAPPADPGKVKVDLGPPLGIQEVQAINSMISDLQKQVKSSQDTLNGFVSKWVQEWNLPASSSLVDVEAEMSKLLIDEDSIQKFRDNIEAVVGTFDSDDALFQALGAVKTEISDKDAQITTLTQKLANAQVPAGYVSVKSWTIGSLLFKLYKGVKTS